MTPDDRRTTVLPLALTARQWATIDATMDNTAQNAIDDGADDTPATAVREAGWAQVPWAGETREWPPDPEVITIELDRDQWDLVLVELDRSDARAVRRGDESGAALGRDAARAVRTQLPS